MWRLFLGMTLLGLFCFPLQLQATASSLASQASAATSTGQGISITSQGIQIRVNERPLLDILKDIQHLSGIDFLLSPDIEGISVTTTIDAPDWPTAVQQLLRSFSTAETWSQDGKQLRQVVILKHTEEQPLLPETPHPLADGSQKLEGAYLLEPPPASSLPPVPPPPPFPPEFQ